MSVEGMFPIELCSSFLAALVYTIVGIFVKPDEKLPLLNLGLKNGDSLASLKLLSLVFTTSLLEGSFYSCGSILRYEALIS